jgi:hypothetical protein
MATTDCGLIMALRRELAHPVKLLAMSRYLMRVLSLIFLESRCGMLVRDACVYLASYFIYTGCIKSMYHSGYSHSNGEI